MTSAHYMVRRATKSTLLMGFGLLLSAASSPGRDAPITEEPVARTAVMLEARADRSHQEGDVTFLVEVDAAGQKQLTVSVPGRVEMFPIETLPDRSELFHWGSGRMVDVWGSRGFIAQEDLDGALRTGYQGLRSGTYASRFAWDSLAHGDTRLSIHLSGDTDVVVVPILKEEGRCQQKRPFYNILHTPPQLCEDIANVALYDRRITAEQFGRLMRGVGLAGILERMHVDESSQWGARIEHVIFQDAAPLRYVTKPPLAEMLTQLEVSRESELAQHAMPMAMLQVGMVGRLAQRACAERDDCDADSFQSQLLRSIRPLPSWAWVVRSLEDDTERDSVRRRIHHSMPTDGFDRRGFLVDGHVDMAKMCRSIDSFKQLFSEGPAAVVLERIRDGACFDQERSEYFDWF